jgi:hypothetical protein
MGQIQKTALVACSCCLEKFLEKKIERDIEDFYGAIALPSRRIAKNGACS